MEAAMQVLLAHGLAGCTSRAIAEASAVAKSALHYYFRDTEEIVDLAFRRLIGEFVERIEAAAAAAPDPQQGLRAAAATYLYLGSSGHSAALPMLWFEMQLAARRSGNTATMRELSGRIIDMLVALLRQIGTAEPENHARVLVSSLFGILIRDAVQPADLDRELDACLRVLHLKPPDLSPRCT
ncbi:MAG: TetR/AcrR family transcriptional regulator [Candidatus Binatia bacterium]